MADDKTTTVDIDVMIIEAGIMANSLTPTDAGKALQAKIQAAADEAWAQQKPDVVLSFNPFEAGMMLGGLSQSSGNVTGDLINRTFSAVNAKLEELGIQALNNPTPPSLGDQGPAAGMDPSQLPSGDASNTTSTDSSAQATDSSPSESSSSTSSDDQATDSSASVPQDGTGT